MFEKWWLARVCVQQLNLRQFNCLRESVSLRLSRLGAPRRRPLNGTANATNTSLSATRVLNRLTDALAFAPQEVPVRRSNRVNTGTRPIYRFTSPSFFLPWTYAHASPSAFVCRVVCRVVLCVSCAV
jgi:hypothetical protein